LSKIKFSPIEFFHEKQIIKKSFFDYSTNVLHFLLPRLFNQLLGLNINFQNMGSVFSSPTQVQPMPKPSSPRKIQLEFVPLLLDAGPISVSDDPSTLSKLPQEILPKIAGFLDIGTIRNLIFTCKSIRNCLETSFLKALASEKNPDRATSGFIADAIGNDDGTCLWRNADISLEGHKIPYDLSIHLFINKTAKKILSHEVRSMIIYVSQPTESSELCRDICEFLGFLFSAVSFTNLKCLMLYGIRFWEKFSHWIGALNLEALHMAKFSYTTFLTERGLLSDCNALERLYIVHPNSEQTLVSPKTLKKLVTYCPESSESVIQRMKPHSHGLSIDLVECRALEEM
jgi:hypothetical protein